VFFFFISRRLWVRGWERGHRLMCGIVLEVEDLEKLAPQLLLDF
jgi:hypothetical protein